MPITEVYIPKVESNEKKKLDPKFRGRRIGAAVAAIAVVGGAMANISLNENHANEFTTFVEGLSGPTYSDETQDWIAQPGDGLIDAANDVEGIESVDYRDVVHEIENMNVEALADGLQAGETLIIPQSVEQ